MGWKMHIKRLCDSHPWSHPPVPDGLAGGWNSLIVIKSVCVWDCTSLDLQMVLIHWLWVIFSSSLLAYSGLSLTLGFSCVCGFMCWLALPLSVFWLWGWKALVCSTEVGDSTVGLFSLLIYHLMPPKQSPHPLHKLFSIGLLSPLRKNRHMSFKSFEDYSLQLQWTHSIMLPIGCKGIHK